MKTFIFVLFSLITPLICASQSSLVFDGLDDQVVVKHHNDFNLGTGDFTIELKVKSIPNLKSNLTLLSKRGNTSQGLNLSVTTTGNKGKFKVQLGNKTHSLKDSNLKDGQCHFLAIRRKNNKVRLYFDNIATNTGKNNNDISSLVDLLIGADGVPVNLGGGGGF